MINSGCGLFGTKRRITAKKKNAVTDEITKATKLDMLHGPSDGDSPTTPELNKDTSGVKNVESKITKPIKMVNPRSLILYTRKNFGVGILKMALRPVRRELNKADEVQMRITKPTKPAVLLEFRMD